MSLDSVPSWHWSTWKLPDPPPPCVTLGLFGSATRTTKWSSRNRTLSFKRVWTVFHQSLPIIIFYGALGRKDLGTRLNTHMLHLIAAGEDKEITKHGKFEIREGEASHGFKDQCNWRRWNDTGMFCGTFLLSKIYVWICDWPTCLSTRHGMYDMQLCIL